MCYYESAEYIEKLRKEFPNGTRVKLIYMEDDCAPKRGTEGTVTGVDDSGQIHVKWDGGGCLALVPELDEWVKL